MKPVDVIEVLLWGKRVGATTADPALGCYAFEYEPSWKRRAIELAPLTMPLSDRRQTFTFPALPKPTYFGLPSMLADALPDDFGNALIDDKELGTGAGYGRIEYAYSLMAKEAGVIMSPCRLLEENGRAHFMTKRFDREEMHGNTQKHHLQTLCAMNHLDFRQRGTHAYEQLFMTIGKLGLDDEARSQTFRRMAFNVMARNCDDHTKNFAFLLKRGHSWQLAPAYDVTHAYNPKGEWTYQHLMSVNGKFQDIARADLMEVADRFGVRRPQDALADVRAALDNWSGFAQDAGISSSLRDRVAQDLLPV